MIKFNKLNEDIAGLPLSTDPYAPSARPDVRMSSDTSEPAKADELPEVETPLGGKQPLEPANAMLPPPVPVEPAWEPFKLPDKRDLGFRRTDGFFLRFRKLSVPNKYLAQLWRDSKVLSKGQIVIPVGEDPVTYIQSVAGEMLDAGSQRRKQEMPAEPSLGAQPEPGMPEEPETPEPGTSEEEPTPEVETPPEEIDIEDFEEAL